MLCKQCLCTHKDSKLRLPALPETVVSACWDSVPSPLNSPVAGAGCAFVSRTLLFLLRRNRRDLRPLAERKTVSPLFAAAKKSSKEYREIINGMAEKLQIADKLKSTVKHLSGGERQRVAIIRSMVNDQKIILADEPTGSLDKDNSAIVIHCLRELAHDLQRAVVIVTHAPDVARQCDRTFLLADGSLTPWAL